jgi:hypothetical protein
MEQWKSITWFSILFWFCNSSSRGQCFRMTFSMTWSSNELLPSHKTFCCIANENEKVYHCQDMCYSELEGKCLHFKVWQYAFCMPVFLQCSYLYSCRARYLTYFSGGSSLAPLLKETERTVVWDTWVAGIVNST